MKNRILKTLTENWEFKILSVFFAFIMWLAVYNGNDPVATRQFTITVQIENEDVLENNNLYYQVLNSSNEVSFYISAKRSVLDKLDDESFVAVADMKNLVKDSSGKKGKVKIAITPRQSIYKNSFNIPKDKYLEVSLEQSKEKALNVELMIKDDVQDGYAIGDYGIIGDNVVNVYGPASIVESIGKAKAIIDVSDLTTNSTKDVNIQLFDKEDEKITDISNLKISINTVKVMVEVLPAKAVKVVFHTFGKPAGQNEIESVTPDDLTVKIKGDASILNGIDAIEVPAEVLDVTNAKKSFTKEVIITEYLPQGVSLVDPGEANVTVEVKIKVFGTKTYSINTSGLTVEGLSDGYELVFRKPSIDIKLSGTKKDLDALKASSISGTIDVSGLDEGKHSVVVVFNLDNNLFTYDTVRVELTIRKKSADDGGDNDNSDSSDNQTDPDNP